MTTFWKLLTSISLSQEPSVEREILNFRKCRCTNSYFSGCEVYLSHLSPLVTSYKYKKSRWRGSSSISYNYVKYLIPPNRNATLYCACSLSEQRMHTNVKTSLNSCFIRYWTGIMVVSLRDSVHYPWTPYRVWRRTGLNAANSLEAAESSLLPSLTVTDRLIMVPLTSTVIEDCVRT